MMDNDVPFDPLAGWGRLATALFAFYFWLVRW